MRLLPIDSTSGLNCDYVNDSNEDMSMLDWLSRERKVNIVESKPKLADELLKEAGWLRWDNYGHVIHFDALSTFTSPFPSLPLVDASFDITKVLLLYFLHSTFYNTSSWTNGLQTRTKL